MTPALAFSLIAVASVVTSFISGILGMAGGMILMGVLLALLPLPAAMLLHGISQLTANGWRAFQLRDRIDWRVFRGYVVGAALALTVFALLQLVASKPVALILMGLTPFVALALPERLHLNVERRGHSFLCGLVNTAIALVAGISGPILDLFFIRSKMGRHAVVATKGTVQSLSHLMKIGYFGGILALSSENAGARVDPLLATTVVVLAVVGTTLSKQVLEKISDASFRRWTRWTVMTLGGFYLASGVLALLAA
jgi:uncharacterized membrane protein YfcA